jgi:hypothetical protein
MKYYNLDGQPSLDSPTDNSSAAATGPQQGFGSPAPAAPSSDPGPSGSSPVPGSLTFVSDDGGPPPTSTSTATTTQTVSFANSGLVFNNTYTGNVSAAYQSCILSAEQTLASICTNSVTINVEFDAEAEGQNGELASNEFWTVDESYSSLKSALTSLSAEEPNNTVLKQAVANLPTTDPSGGQGFELPLAYAQILGLSTETRSPEDIVTLNTSYNWSYGQDVINTVEHEISEGGMGRIGGLGDQNSFWSTMDLFRYNSSGQPDYTDGRDGRTTYFSYNGGATLSTLSFNNEYSGSTKVNGGDVADFTQQDVFGTGSPGETNTLSQTDLQMMEALGWSPPVTTTAEMILTDTSGNYYIDDIASNSLQGSNLLENLGTGFTFGGIGNFGGDSGDMMLRASNGDLYIYDISNNQIIGTHDLGNVGTDWSIAGFGDFSGNPGETDLVMRQSSGNLEVYDISNNQVTFATSLGNFGTNTVAGFGDFSGKAGETDMMMRSSTGDLLVYDMGKNSVTSGPIDLGNVGLNWAVYGFGDFSSNPNETDLIMRDTTTGNFELYDISDNRVVSAKALGNVGLDWTLAGFGDFSGNPGETDMLLRQSSTGDFEVYDFANNQIYNANSAGQVTVSETVSGTGPNVPGSDTALSTSLSADAGSTSASAGGVTADLMAASFGQNQQSIGSTSGLSAIVPPMSSFLSTPAQLDPSPSMFSEQSTAAPALAANLFQHSG